mmetsp:Transcript_40560/g.129321  ORF Transcript_40560/g.129321 Transcript_40560/m.129321 type:complete len:375 (-) Transcript_40560:499-1623(-)
MGDVGDEAGVDHVDEGGLGEVVGGRLEELLDLLDVLGDGVAALVRLAEEARENLHLPLVDPPLVAQGGVVLQPHELVPPEPQPRAHKEPSQREGHGGGADHGEGEGPGVVPGLGGEGARGVGAVCDEYREVRRRLELVGALVVVGRPAHDLPVERPRQQQLDHSARDLPGGDEGVHEDEHRLDNEVPRLSHGLRGTEEVSRGGVQGGAAHAPPELHDDEEDGIDDAPGGVDHVRHASKLFLRELLQDLELAVVAEGVEGCDEDEDPRDVEDGVEAAHRVCQPLERPRHPDLVDLEAVARVPQQEPVGRVHDRQQVEYRQEPIVSLLDGYVAELEAEEPLPEPVVPVDVPVVDVGSREADELRPVEQPLAEGILK